MRVAILSQEDRDSEPEKFGEVWVAEDGTARWDPVLDRLMHDLTTGNSVNRLDPKNGEYLVKKLPLRIANAPYLWAEKVSE